MSADGSTLDSLRDSLSWHTIYYAYCHDLGCTHNGPLFISKLTVVQADILPLPPRLAAELHLGFSHVTHFLLLHVSWKAICIPDDQAAVLFERVRPLIKFLLQLMSRAAFMCRYTCCKWLGGTK